MILDLAHQHTAKDLIPFFKNGILIDTSVLIIFIDGFIRSRYTKVNDQEYISLLKFLDLINMNNQWNRFIITPHILTEACTYFRKTYSKKWGNFKELANDIIPIFDAMQDISVSKESIIGKIDLNSPVVEIGDISIFLVADDVSHRKDKTSILVKDRRFNDEYRDNINVMIMDYNNILLNLV